MYITYDLTQQLLSYGPEIEVVEPRELKAAIVEKLKAFRHARNWEQFHTPKNLSMGITIEASELMQEFLWKNDEEVFQRIKEHRENVADEIADIASYVFLLADDLGLDLFAEIERKMAKNAEKYPVEKCFGKATKYNELK